MLKQAWFKQSLMHCQISSLEIWHGKVFSFHIGGLELQWTFAVAQEPFLWDYRVSWWNLRIDLNYAKNLKFLSLPLLRVKVKLRVTFHHVSTLSPQYCSKLLPKSHFLCVVSSVGSCLKLIIFTTLAVNFSLPSVIFSISWSTTRWNWVQKPFFPVSVLSMW